MPNLNKVQLIGNVGKVPEIRHTQSGKAVANFSVATNEYWKDIHGEKQQRSEWHKIVAWDKSAEFAGEYLKPGNLVYIEGKLQTRSWDDSQTGQKKYATEIRAYNIQPLEKKQNNQETNQPNSQTQTQPSNDDQSPF